uniref:Glycosyl transferase n=1 Tax=uncultured marine group II/III euryarchaeote KM3_160_F12 TaxID=1457912 RepID=A0A075GMB5_9EURY|nr:glycosyl transferase [uncultured marine group II/III euryarchaeote KM3_160_F12]
MASEKAQNTRIARLEREINRLRSSPSLRLGSHITNAMRQPWRAPFLLFTLPWQMLMIGLEMLGRRPAVTQDSLELQKAELHPKNTVVMFPTNGVGFGHFTRLLALAKQMKKADATLEVIFFTTMPTLHLLKPFGIAAHHISGPKYFDDLEATEWNSLLEEELTICLETHRPKMFIFDGAFPYRGMLRSIKNRRMHKVWVRRGMFRKDATNIPVDSIEHFDTLVRPGDSSPTDSTDEQNISIKQFHCNPILFASKDELYPREYLREQLGIPLDSVVVYVQLGAGEINDIESDLDLSIRLLSKYEDVYIVIGESMIGNRLNITGERIRTLRDYPNSLYFNSFDFAIMAGGYNSYHEAIAFQLPTICIPNKSTGMDDQVARVAVAADANAMYVIQDATEDKLSAAISSMMDIGNRKEIIDAAVHLHQSNGAEELSSRLIEM